MRLYLILTLLGPLFCCLEMRRESNEIITAEAKHISGWAGILKILMEAKDLRVALVPKSGRGSSFFRCKTATLSLLFTQVRLQHTHTHTYVHSSCHMLVNTLGTQLQELFWVQYFPQAHFSIYTLQGLGLNQQPANHEGHQPFTCFQSVLSSPVHWSMWCSFSDRNRYN